MKKKWLIGSLTLTACILLTACNESEKHVFEDFVVNKDDLQEEKNTVDKKTKEEIEMDLNNEKIKNTVAQTYIEDIDSIENESESYKALFDADGNLKEDVEVVKKLDSFDKWDAIVILNILNQYDSFFKQKDDFLKKVSDLSDFSGDELLNNEKINELVYEIDEMNLFEDITDEQFFKLYNKLKDTHQFLIHLIIDESKNGLNQERYNAIKKQYDISKENFIVMTNISNLMTEQEFRNKYE